MKLVRLILSCGLALYTLVCQGSTPDNWSTYSRQLGCKEDTCAINQLYERYVKIRFNLSDSAKELVLAAFERSRRIEYEKGIALGYHYLGDYFSNIGEFDIALSYADTAIEISLNNGFSEVLSNAYILQGIIYSDQGNYEESFLLYNKGLQIAQQSNYKLGIANAYSNIGVNYYLTGDYGSAIENYLVGLKILEVLKDSTRISMILSNLAVFYQYKGQLEKAINTLFESLNYLQQGDFKNIADVYNNIAVDYKKLDSVDLCVQYYTKSLELRKKIDDFRGISASYNNLAEIYITLREYDKSTEYIKKALEISRKNGYKSDEIYFLKSMAINYYYAGQYQKALAYCLESLELSSSFGEKSIEVDNYSLLADIYSGLGRYKESSQAFFTFRLMNDSLIKNEYANNIAEMDAKYQTEKKQLQIKTLEKDAALKNATIAQQVAENKKQQVIIISFVIGFALIVMFTLLLIRMFMQKKKANIVLAARNEEILQQKEEIEVQRDEIAFQRDFVMRQGDKIAAKNQQIQKQNKILTRQKEEIEEIHKEITDSIIYAKRIQTAILPPDDYLAMTLPEHFILLKPRDIVSGDFYWTKQGIVKDKQGNEEILLLTAVADCTGHGVPGAFMSMLGIAFLNEIITKTKYYNASDILDQLRLEIISALNQSGQDVAVSRHEISRGETINLNLPDKVQASLTKVSEVKDGMDITLTILNTTTLELQYAGANNPLYIVTNQNETPDLVEIKPDKMPVGLHYEGQVQQFNCHNVQLRKKDTIYLFSDGFADQFGGASEKYPTGKKFKYKPFKELLISLYDKPMEAQKQTLNATFEEWRGNLDQVDDVCIMGIRV